MITSRVIVPGHSGSSGVAKGGNARIACRFYGRPP